MGLSFMKRCLSSTVSSVLLYNNNNLCALLTGSWFALCAYVSVAICQSTTTSNDSTVMYLEVVSSTIVKKPTTLYSQMLYSEVTRKPTDNSRKPSTVLLSITPTELMSMATATAVLQYSQTAVMASVSLASTLQAKMSTDLSFSQPYHSGIETTATTVTMSSSIRHRATSIIPQSQSSLPTTLSVAISGSVATVTERTPLAPTTVPSKTLQFTTHVSESLSVSTSSSFDTSSPVTRSSATAPKSSTFSKPSLTSSVQPPSTPYEQTRSPTLLRPTPTLTESEMRPTEREDVSPTGYRELDFAVASVAVALFVLVGSVLAVAATGLFMHCRTWRVFKRPRVARSLEKRSESFRYNQSY